MLKNIKSVFFIRVIFSFLEEKQKLKIVKYNKTLQIYINNHLTNYKFFTGKYIIYLSSDKGKEYNGSSNDLIYEGEYSNGERNGKGKEYNEDGKLSFEGEYLNGKRNGKGKEFYDDGKLSFEGEYLNGIARTGKGYDRDGNVSYEFKNDNNIPEAKHYHQREYGDYGEVIFEGEYLNGERDGKGK